MITAESPRVQKQNMLRWKMKNIVQTRLREYPSELYLAGTRVARHFIRGANVPQHSTLHALLFRGDMGKPKDWEVAGISRHGVMFLTPDNGLEFLTKWQLRNKGFGFIEDYGLLGSHLIVTAGKNYLAGSFNNTNEPELLRYHGFGTGTTSPVVGNTALETELTTQYAGDVRPTGSQSVTNAVYTSIATLSPDSGGTIAVTEWGLLTQAATGGGTLLDRQTFSAINVVASSDSLQVTYNHTVG